MTQELIQKALPGVHDSAYAIFSKFFETGARVLDLGAGSGAWSMRLHQAGLNVHAADLNRAAFKAEGIQFDEVNLNEAFAERISGGPYDLISSIEVIEHLENPRHFLRQCKKLLKSGGILLVTTPNIECLPGRLRFLLDGHFRMFHRDPSYNDPTHITPIQSYMFERMTKDAGFKILKHEFNSPAPIHMRKGVAVVASLLSRVVRGTLGGDNHIYILKSS